MTEDFHYDTFDEEFVEMLGSNYETLKKKIENKLLQENACEHATTFDGDSISICKDCGCEIENLDFQPEWRYYGASDNKLTRDPSRCHKGKEIAKGSIEKVFQDCNLMHLPLSIRKAAETKYKEVVGEGTIRGKGRKAIVAACLLSIYRDDGDIRTSDEVRNMFGIGRQEMSAGLCKYYSVFEEDRIKTVNPEDLIYRIMKVTCISMDHYKNILNLMKCLDKSDVVINRSSPQAVAAAIIFLYVCINQKLKKEINFNRKSFAKNVKLSELTIVKLVKKAVSILDISVKLN